ncbi:hypothetical protein EYD46_11180 [Hyunsoonleella pacifica]|uniref:Uncharacterized protein n=2 Tax=Hyunsoonleella pacifica TaxID=1080224 RepID=A0A4Q9FNJ6_9FLAO|nr:hypothetical protein EYD46_11180 [Hyunsoonleella pacifica]GGD21752.1 hypothetical protein GCM10011368_24740 [Hyunsoonleella pacifica]
MEYPYQIKKATFCKYVLCTPNKDIHLNFPQMLELRRKINELTAFNSLTNIINTDNFVLLFIADKQHLLYLDIPQLLKLRDEIMVLFHAPSISYV